MRNLKRSGKANFKFIGVSEKHPRGEANGGVDGNGLKAYFFILSLAGDKMRGVFFGSCKLSTRKNPTEHEQHSTLSRERD